MKKRRIGGSFDAFLKEEGLYEEVTARAIKRVIARMPGEKGKAICESDGRVSTTFRYRDVPFSDGSGIAKKILVGVCDRCGKVVAIPPQSTPSIRAANSLLATAAPRLSRRDRS